MGLLFSAIWTAADCSQSGPYLSSPSGGYMHVAHARCPQGNSTPVGWWMYWISNTLHVAAAANTVISLARWTTQAAALLILLLTHLSSISLCAGRMSQHALCSRSEPGILDNVAFTEQRGACHDEPPPLSKHYSCYTDRRPVESGDAYYIYMSIKFYITREFQTRGARYTRVHIILEALWYCKIQSAVEFSRIIIHYILPPIWNAARML